MIAIDTHTHVYPEVPIEELFAYADRNISASAKRQGNNIPGAKLPAAQTDAKIVRQIILCICDRVGFPSLREVMHSLLERGAESESDLSQAAFYHFEKGDRGFGALESKQWVTSDGFEILALGSALKLPDRLSVVEYYRQIEHEGSIPVVPWSPGKWTGERGRALQKFLDECPPDRIYLGDVYIRPAALPLPEIMRQHLCRGGRVIYGTDPLPFAGEVKHSGRLATKFMPPTDSSEIENAAEVIQLIRNSHAERLGFQSDLFTSAWRTLRSNLNRSRHAAG